jgi:hypothetical protein
MRDTETTTTIRKLVLGLSLYNSCIKLGGKIDKSHLEARLKQLQFHGHFKGCKVNDLVSICDLKANQPLHSTTTPCLDELEEKLPYIAKNFHRNPKEIKNMFDRRDPPFYYEDLPETKTPNFLLRDNKNIPYRDCHNEPKDEIKQPDTSPKLSIKENEHEKLLEQYICDLQQTKRNAEVEEWMRANPTLTNPYRFALSDNAHNWLQNFLDGDTQMNRLDIVMTIDPEIKAELQQFRFKTPIKAYRGIHFDMDRIDLVSRLCMDKWKPGYYYHYIDDRASSWTWNFKMAENFGQLGSFNFVLQHTFQPDDILIDLRLLQDYCDMRGVINKNDLRGLQDEIIVMPGEYACEVFDAPFHRNELLREENIQGLERLSLLLSKFPHEPSAGAYGGHIGGLCGSITFFPSTDVYGRDQPVKLLFSFTRKNDKYDLFYCFLSPLSKIENISSRDERKQYMDQPHEDFYEFVNRNVQYLVHHGDRYMKAYMLLYGKGSPHCKDKCNDYRYEGVIVECPYVLRSDSFEFLVHAFASDVMAIDNAFKHTEEL